ncbi:MAG: hypothetical protein ACRDRT_05100, partial [Pseudonocardiaceae bacterium]
VWIMVAILAVVAAVVLVKVRSRPRVSTPQDAAAAASLVEVLAEGQGAVYHATFKTSSPDGSGVLDIWRSGPNFRQRVEAKGEGTLPERTDLVVSGSDVVSCAQTGDRPWNCTRVPELRDQLNESIAAPPGKLTGQRVTEDTRTIGDVDARCFTVDASRASDEVGGGVSEVCVTGDGIPVRLSSEGSVTELVALVRTLTPEDFKPPASPPASGG